METALLDVTNCLLGADEGQVSILTSLNLSAMFNTLNHSIILAHLRDMFGVSGKTLEWFLSYLSDRLQYVSVVNITKTLNTVGFLISDSRRHNYLDKRWQHSKFFCHVVTSSSSTIPVQSEHPKLCGTKNMILKHLPLLSLLQYIALDNPLFF